jgi:NADP-dependent aldehyde dehydrogenase
MAGVDVLAEGSTDRPEVGWWGTPLLLRAQPDAVNGRLTEECFGPVLVLVEYESTADLPDVLRRLGPALTATIHADDDDRAVATEVFGEVRGRVGRVVWNGFPTGVAVSWAMQHGGPYPATTNELHTSVGTAAIRRWLRPISYQQVPEYLLPDELRDGYAESGFLRRVDGRLTVTGADQGVDR